eukprot:2335212-Pleurochrysis_carterae.AAC.2
MVSMVGWYLGMVQVPDVFICTKISRELNMEVVLRTAFNGQMDAAVAIDNNKYMVLTISTCKA